MKGVGPTHDNVHQNSGIELWCRVIKLKGPIHSSYVVTFSPNSDASGRGIRGKVATLGVFLLCSDPMCDPVSEPEVLHKGYMGIAGRESCLHVSDANACFVQGPHNRSGSRAAAREAPRYIRCDFKSHRCMEALIVGLKKLDKCKDAPNVKIKQHEPL